jgi:geranylgeranyl pyrophosphate synthase
MSLGTGPLPQRSPSSASPLDLVATELGRVEERLLELAASREPKLERIATDLIAAGGKRLRPALALLVFRAAGGDDPTDVVDIAAALELIHSATLLHDDIIDEGHTRRGQPSPLARHGMALTLVTGDFLFSRAFGVAGRFDESIVSWAAEACVSLSEGEVMQQRFWRSPAVTVNDYFEIASRKTAALFAQAARIGAYMAGATEPVVEAMRCLGLEIGMGFQMIDDLLDVLGPATVIGKPVGGDLREGIPALPIVLGLAQLPELEAAFATDSPTAQQVASALSALTASNVLDQVRSFAAARIRAASASISLLPSSPYRSALAQLLAELLARTS